MRRIFRSIVLFLIATVHALASTGATKSVTVTARFRPGRPLHRFLPSHTLGGGIDGENSGAQDKKITPANIQAMFSPGLKSLDYRLRIELTIDDWQLNPEGRWSDTTPKE